jgi:MarR-like DNA-binding transcriptional regulator SgrR of sgrS sRNA
MKHNHYFKSTVHLDAVDVYRVLELFEVTNPCLQHAVKKLLCAGDRGAKDMEQDVQEAMDTLERWQDMCREDELIG